MNIEIERKFLVSSDDFKTHATAHFTIAQGFLNRDPERTVRVRLMKDEGVLTVKGMGSKSGLSRFEWESKLSKSDAEDLLNLCEPGIIKKVRYIIPAEPYCFEVDVFQGDNRGLVLAEIELETEDADFSKPSWLGEEVTGDKRYYNSYLSAYPFMTWKP